MHRPRRPWFALDPLAALDRLRALLARLGRGPADPPRARASLELFRLDARSSPSEMLFSTALPLALTAAGAAADLSFRNASAAASADPHVSANWPAVSTSPFEFARPAFGADAAPPVRDPASGDAGGVAGTGRRGWPDDDDPAGLGIGSGSGGPWYGGFPGAATPREGGGGGDGGSAPPTAGNAAPNPGRLPEDRGESAPVPRAKAAPGPAAPVAASESAGGPGAGSPGGPGGAGASEPTAADLTPGEAPAPLLPRTHGETPFTRPAPEPQVLTDTPVRFVANAGQWDDAVDFALAGENFRAWVTRDAAVLGLPRAATGAERAAAHARDAARGDRPSAAELPNPGGRPGAETADTRVDVVRMEWGGINRNARAVGVGTLGSKSNFLLGNDPAGWHANVPEYSSVRYAGAWRGIDLVYRRSADGGLEYDLEVQPGADLAAVSLRFEGASTRVEGGRLVLTTPGGAVMTQSAPLLYQAAADGSRRPVAGGYEVRADGSVGFAAADYDRSRRLVVDPTLAYNTAFGGSQSAALGLAADAYGNAVAVGRTTSSSFPVSSGTLGGDEDAFVAQFDPSGYLTWSTYLGGTTSPAAEAAHAVAVGPDGGVYVGGYTEAADFPATTGAFQTSPGSAGTAFLAKLAAGGSYLEYATYFGGTGGEVGYGVAVDASAGEAVLVGSTTSSDLPTTNAYDSTLGGSVDAFAARFTADGTGLVFATYLGGTTYSYAEDESARAVAVDGAGYAHVAGDTTDPDFPTPGGYDTSLGGAADAFLARLSPGGSLTTATFLGGSGAEAGRGVAASPDGTVYLTGSTGSGDFPTVNPAQGALADARDAFLARFAALGSAPLFATYADQGGGSDVGNGVAADSSNRAVVVGTGASGLWVARYADGGWPEWADAQPGGVGSAAAVSPDGSMFAAGAYGSDALIQRYAPDLEAPAGLAVTDDTGSSPIDRVTADTTLTVTGTALEGSLVALWHRGPGDPTWLFAGWGYVSGGAWSVDLPGTLAEGTHRVLAQAFYGGAWSPWGIAGFVVDTTAPALAVSVVAQTYDRRPAVVVTASDRGGLASPATVTLDADLNNDSDYDDTDELGYAEAPLVNGRADFTSYPYLPAGGPVTLRARAADLAGNEGTSPGKTVDVQSSPSSWSTGSLTPATRSGYAGPGVNALMAAGDVTARHHLDIDVSREACGCTDELVYHSLEASPAPTVRAVIQSDNAVGLPSAVVATLTWDGGAGGSKTFTGADLDPLSPGGAWVFGVAPTGSLGTGRHTYTLDVFLDYGGTGDVTRSVSGQTFLVDRSAGPYGAGWAFANADALVIVLVQREMEDPGAGVCKPRVIVVTQRVRVPLPCSAVRR